jgi:hypothetical protein
VKFPLKEIQSTRTQRPTADSSCPYVEVALGDVTAQHTVQLQLEQVGPLGSCPAPSLPTPEFCTLCSPRPDKVLGSVQPSIGDRAKPTLHRPAGLKMILETYLDGGILETRAQVVCRRMRYSMGNWGCPKGP